MTATLSIIMPDVAEVPVEVTSLTRDEAETQTCECGFPGMAPMTLWSDGFGTLQCSECLLGAIGAGIVAAIARVDVADAVYGAVYTPRHARTP